MTIYWDFETVTERRTDVDGNEYETEKRGPVRVWFHDRDPATDEPHQTVDWRAEGLQLTVSDGGNGWPACVETYAARAEVESELTGEGQFINGRTGRIYRDLISKDVVRAEQDRPAAEA